MVNALHDRDCNSGSSYDTEDELNDPDDEDNHEMDVKYYSIEKMVNNTGKVFDAPHKETYNNVQYITKVEIEMMLPSVN